MSVKTSVIPEGLTLVGSIEGKGDLVIAGTVEGPIELSGELVIEPGGVVRGDVRAEGLVVRGLLAGDASAKSGVRVEPTATVIGDVSAPRVNIVDGAKVRGRVSMTGEPIVPKSVRRRRRQPPPEEAPVIADDHAPTTPGMPAPVPATPRKRQRTRPSREAKPPPPAPEPQRAPEAIRERSEPRTAAPVPEQSASVPEQSAPQNEPSAEEPGSRRRRKRRRGRGRGRRPPPPNIPTVPRQKARRKDRSTEAPEPPA